ncbi:MAG: hypothetical protein AAF244_04070 [Pseudomonadota bacterium]
MNTKRPTQNFKNALDRIPFERPITQEETVDYIAKVLVTETVRYITDADFADFSVYRYVTEPSEQLPAMHNFVIDFNDNDKQNQLLRTTQQINQNRLVGRLGQNPLVVNIEGSKFKISVAYIEDLAPVIEETTLASNKKHPVPKTILEKNGLGDPEITNLRLMPAQQIFGSAKGIVKFYNSSARDTKNHPFQTFTYLPEDLVKAANALEKQSSDLKGISSSSLLYLH